jgi:hypothetical protein
LTEPHWIHFSTVFFSRRRECESQAAVGAVPAGPDWEFFPVQWHTPKILRRRSVWSEKVEITFGPGTLTACIEISVKLLADIPDHYFRGDDGKLRLRTGGRYILVNRESLMRDLDERVLFRNDKGKEILPPQALRKWKWPPRQRVAVIFVMHTNSRQSRTRGLGRRGPHLRSEASRLLTIPVKSTCPRSRECKILFEFHDKHFSDYRVEQESTLA